MAQVEFVAKLRADTTDVMKKLQDIGQKVEALENNQIAITFEYNNNMSDFQNKIRQVMNACPELGIQFQYDINKRALLQSKDLLENMTTVKTHIDNKDVDSYIKGIIEEFKQLSKSGVDGKTLLQPYLNILNIMETIQKNGYSLPIDDYLDELFDYVKHIQDIDFTGFEGRQLFDLKDFETVKKNVTEFEEILEKLKSKGAKDMNTDGFNELEERMKMIEDKVVILQNRINNFNGKGFKDAAGDAQLLYSQLSNILGVIDKISGRKNITTSDIFTHIGDLTKLNTSEYVRSDNLGVLGKQLSWGFGSGSGLFYAHPNSIEDSTYSTMNQGMTNESFTGRKAYFINSRALSEQLNQLSFETSEMENRGLDALKAMNEFVFEMAVGIDKINELQIEPSAFNSVDELYDEIKEAIPGFNLTLSDFSNIITSNIDKIKSLGNMNSEGAFESGKYLNDMLPSDQMLLKLGYTGFSPGTSYYSENDGLGVGGWIIEPEKFLSNIDTATEYLGVFTQAESEAAIEFSNNLDKFVSEFNGSVQSTGQIIEGLINKIHSIFEEVQQIKNATDVDVNNNVDLKNKDNTDEDKTSTESIDKKAEAYNREEQIVKEVIANEESILSSLCSELDTVIDKIDEKTRAFQEEGQIVDGVVQNEINNLTILSGFLNNLRDDTSKVSEEFKGMDLSINSDVDVSNITNAMSSLSKVKTDGIITKLITVYDTLQDFASAVNSIQINDSGLLGVINSLLSKSKELENLATALKSSVKQINAVKKATNNTANTKDVFITQGSSEWNKITSYVQKFAATYNQEMGSVKQITRSVRESNGELLESYKVLDTEGNSFTVGLNGDVVASKQNVVDLTSRYNELGRVLSKLDDISLDNSGKYTDDFKADVDSIRAEILSFPKIDPTDPDAVNQLNELIQRAKELEASAKKTDNVIGNTNSLEKVRGKISDILNDYKAMPRELKNQFEDLRERAKNLINLGSTKEDVDAINAEFVKLNATLSESGKKYQSLFAQMFERLRSQSSQLLAQYFSFQDLLRYGRQAISTIIDLDYQLVDLRKTTTMTTGELDEFYHSSANIAKQLGVTSSEIISQAAAWSRLGYSSKEAATEMAKLSSKFATVSPGMTTDQSTDYLVSTMQAYGIAVDDVERKIMDNVNRIGKILPKHMVTYGVKLLT